MPGFLGMGVGTLGGRVVVACCRESPRRLLWNLHVCPTQSGIATSRAGGYATTLAVSLGPRPRLDQVDQKRFVCSAGSVCARDKDVDFARCTVESKYKSKHNEPPPYFALLLSMRDRVLSSSSTDRVWSVADPCS